jgi:hypothetical protein
MLQAKECAPTPCPFVVFTFKLIIESIKELGGASAYSKKNVKKYCIYIYYKMKRPIIISRCMEIKG